MSRDKLHGRETTGAGSGESYREITSTHDGGTSKNSLDVYIQGGSLGGSSSVYSTRIDEASASVTYIGKAAVASSEASAVWQIFKLSVSGTVTTITYADGDSNFDNIWTNRASLTYS